MVKDVENYKNYNRYVVGEERATRQDTFLNQEFKTPSVASLKKKNS